jgi:LmbE family N-acetylglucosaminyl deacetylase
VVVEIVSAVPALVLAIYAHPDDPDISAGGTIARWARAGSEVHVCICADGDKGTVDSAGVPGELVARRRAEVTAAGAALGVRAHHWLGLADGEITDTLEVRERLVALIRTVRPDTVLAPDPTAVFFGSTYVNHRDHRTVGWLSIDAVAPAAAMPQYFPAAGPPHRVAHLYLSGTLEPDAWVDITTTIDAKAAAIACHESQVGEPGEWLRGVVRQRAEDAGRQAGIAYAEAFRRLVLE